MIYQKRITVVKELARAGTFSIRLFSDGIIEIVWDERIEQIKIHHLRQLRDIIKDFGQGKRMPVYITTFPFMNVSIEAKKFAASDEGQEYTLANAVLVDNLAKKLLFNFFLNINKPKTPTKGFQTRDQAIEWLRQLSNK